MKSLYVLLALAGMGWGQAKIVDSPKNEHISYSDKIVLVGPHESKCSVKSWNNKDLVWETASGNPLTCKVDATGTGFFCKVSPEPEPIDVLAVKELQKQCVHHERYCAVIPEVEHPECPCDRYDDVPVYSCAKGSHRILLQDVDGDWHCIKFGATGQEKKK